MNVRMWQHPATQRNLATLLADGVRVVGPNDGAMAEAEFGPGRMAEPVEIADAAERLLAVNGPLARHATCSITAGPDARAHRSGALHRQPLIGQAGPCHRAGRRQPQARG